VALGGGDGSLVGGVPSNKVSIVRLIVEIRSLGGGDGGGIGLERNAFLSGCRRSRNLGRLLVGWLWLGGGICPAGGRCPTTIASGVVIRTVGNGESTLFGVRAGSDIAVVSPAYETAKRGNKFARLGQVEVKLAAPVVGRGGVVLGASCMCGCCFALRVRSGFEGALAPVLRVAEQCGRSLHESLQVKGL
jgi:hypothetical protein